MVLITPSNKVFEGTSHWFGIDSLHSLKSNLGHFCQIEWAGESSEEAKIAIFDYFYTEVSSGPDFLDSLHTKESNLGHFRQIEWAEETFEVAQIAIFRYCYTKVSSGPDF